MANQYTSEKKTIGELLSLTSPNVVVVPDWQRSFSWTDREVETFWQDLITFSNRYPDNNINNQEYFLGSIVLVSRGNTHELLDGQQRLATSTILLSVIRKWVGSYKEDAATRIAQKYICDLDDATGSVNYKLTLNHYDRDFFKQAIQTFSPCPEPTPKYESHKLISRAREFFERKFADEYGRCGGGQAGYKWALRIRQVLTDHVSAVAVSSEDEDNAAAVFETLNDRGIGLSAPDLLRNLLLRRATQQERNEIIDCWEEVLSLDKLVEQFLRHFWLSRHGDVKTRSLYREIKSHIQSNETNSLMMSRELKNEAELYSELTSASVDDDDIQRLLSEIKLLNANSLYPALLSAFTTWESDGDRSRVVKCLITLFVRHNVIGNLENSKLEALVYSIAKEIRQGSDLDTVTEQIRVAMPNDNDFKTKFKTAWVDTQSAARYLLKKLAEHDIRTGEMAVELPDRVHVEHIYPQVPDPRVKWDNHDSAVNRLGNQTLLAKKLNCAARNEAFERKKPFYQASAIPITKKLANLANWDITQIDRRQAEFADMAMQIWTI